jgi:acyl carrier protein
MASPSSPSGPDWVPDGATKTCMLCSTGFTILRRRHHCRVCGRVVCGNCSTKRVRVKHSTELERACEQCHSQIVKRSIQAKAAQTDRVLYDTFSVCPQCALIDKRGMIMSPAKIVQLNSHIWLTADCQKHGPRKTLVCRDAAFFHRLTSYAKHYEAQQPSANQNQSPASAVAAATTNVGSQPILEMEELLRAMQVSPNSQYEHWPLVSELKLFVQGEFVRDIEIEEELLRIRAMYPSGYSFVIRLTGGLVPKELMPELNRKISSILEYGAAKECPILVDLSFERMIDLANLPDSVLLKGLIYPLVRYFLIKGEEKQCVSELTDVLEAVSTIEDIQVALAINVDAPYADMKPILDFVKSNKNLIRMALFSRERAPMRLYRRFSSRTAAASSTDTDNNDPDSSQQSQHEHKDVDSLDPCELIDALQKASGSKLNMDDFVPMSFARALEPLLKMSGWGQYCLRASPLCLFGTVLINTDKVQDEPITRFLDLQKVFLELQPALRQIERKTAGPWTLKTINKVISRCTQPNQQLPNVMSYLRDDAKSGELKGFLKNMQFIVIHNNMDFAAIDAVRRCQCAIVTRSQAMGSDKVVSSCTGCI